MPWSARSRLQERFENHPAADDLPLWVRIGVHYGRPAQRGKDLVGHDVNLAARIVDLAAPGEVLVSEAAAHEVEETLSYVAFEELGPVGDAGDSDAGADLPRGALGVAVGC